ncbi:MAG: hypothetical protein HXY41_04540 [Chloroflexi bacterium]|nr:hypothetical protein [Chloroflexota bacterium]
MDIHQQIADLQAAVARLEREAARLDNELSQMERELDEFAARYDRLVNSVRVRLEAARAAIEELERRRYLERIADLPPEDEPARPLGFTPVADQYRRMWQDPRPIEPPPPSSDRPRESALPGDPETRLKRLYRALARRYHPDLAANPTDRDYRNKLMMLINEAYAGRDLDTLQLLAEQPEGVHPDAPVAALRLRRLRLTHDELARRVENMRAERDRLVHSDLMRLKTEDKLARQRGRDLLREMAAELEAEYQQAMMVLQKLRAG